ncbi:MAG: phosphate ABC transporter permease PstA [Myxococcales bacterium]|jgi:phosphate transport system permease protein|nr:MAG: phosphate ABC transporter permease PstA [Myxococcales bacterium]
MTESGADSAARQSVAAKHMRRRYAAERRFRAYGIAALGVAVMFLLLLLGSVTYQGLPALRESQIRLAIDFDAEYIDPDGRRDPEVLGDGNYLALARRALVTLFPDVTTRADRLGLYALISSGTGVMLRNKVLADPTLLGRTETIWVTADDDADLFLKGRMDPDVPEADRRLDDDQIGWLRALQREGNARVVFSRTFFTAGDSREPEQAGIRAAAIGSLLTLLVTLLLSFPLAALTAVYLEEFAPENRWTELIEVNINNLAAVPSIIFGLLGLAVFLNFFALPRSAPLVGGMVLALMTLPTIIIAARASLAAVPPSIREAALGIGSSQVQVVTHHVLPLAMPGILTGTIIGMARALGETAPLLMIGMVAFIVDIPGSFTDPATVLPVQVFIWSDSPERAFVAKTAAATMVLIVFLIGMNATAVWMRRRFEQRW